jgi:serine protease AprX
VRLSALAPLESYSSPQLTLLFVDLLQRHPTLTPGSLVCRSCVEASERDLGRRQITEVGGTPHFVDLRLGRTPILSTPERMNASPDYRGRGITIAFVDSGFAPHPDLILPVNRVMAAYNAISGKEYRDIEGGLAESPPASAWHGTMTAAVAAGNGRLSGGYYRGIASEARLVLVKAMTAEGRIRTPQVRAALEWIRANHEKYDIRVVNLSVGVDEATRSLRHPVIALVEELTRRGVTVVAASGNNPAKPLVPPGSAPSAITVGGFNDNNTVDRSRHEAWYSSYGRTPTGARKPELIGPAIWVAAPVLLHTQVKAEAEALFYMVGADDDALMRALPILAPETAIARGLAAARTPLEARGLLLERIRDEKLINAHYKHVDGTSFAAPIVTSIVAQMLEAEPELTPAQIKERLVASALPIEGMHAKKQGAGVPQADRVVGAENAVTKTRGRGLFPRRGGETGGRKKSSRS